MFLLPLVHFLHLVPLLHLLLLLPHLPVLLLLFSQVKCRYKYVRLKTGDTYEFLAAEEVVGMEARLSPEYNAVSVTCRRVGPVRVVSAAVPEQDPDIIEPHQTQVWPTVSESFGIAFENLVLFSAVLTVFARV